MNLIFDTVVLIDIQNRKSETIERLKELSEIYTGPGQITFMTYFEFLFGLGEKSLKNKEIAIAFINNFECLQTTKTTAEILSNLKRKYEKIGKSLSLTDFLIAAQVIENNGTLITRDKDFARIEELKKIFI